MSSPAIFNYVLDGNLSVSSAWNLGDVFATCAAEAVERKSRPAPWWPCRSHASSSLITRDVRTTRSRTPRPDEYEQAPGTHPEERVAFCVHARPHVINTRTNVNPASERVGGGACVSELRHTTTTTTTTQTGSICPAHNKPRNPGARRQSASPD